MENKFELISNDFEDKFLGESLTVTRFDDNSKRLFTGPKEI